MVGRPGRLLPRPLRGRRARATRRWTRRSSPLSDPDPARRVLGRPRARPRGIREFLRYTPGLLCARAARSGSRRRARSPRAGGGRCASRRARAPRRAVAGGRRRPVAVAYEFLEEPRPEIFVKFGAPRVFSGARRATPERSRACSSATRARAGRACRPPGRARLAPVLSAARRRATSTSVVYDRVRALRAWLTGRRDPRAPRRGRLGPAESSPRVTLLALLGPPVLLAVLGIATPWPGQNLRCSVRRPPAVSPSARGVDPDPRAQRGRRRSRRRCAPRARRRRPGRGRGAGRRVDRRHAGDPRAARSASCRALRVVRGRPLPAGWAGKAWACWQLGAEHARHGWLLFVDCDVRLAPDAAARALAAARAQAAHVRLRLPASAHADDRRGAGRAARSISCCSPGCRSGLVRRVALPSLVAGCGQLMLVRRDAYLRRRRAPRDPRHAPRRHHARPAHESVRASPSACSTAATSPPAACTRASAPPGAASPATPTRRSARRPALGRHGRAQRRPSSCCRSWRCRGRSPPPALGLAAAAWARAAAVALAIRAVLAARFGAPAWTAAATPLAVALMLAIQVHSYFNHCIGGARSTWRARVYRARPRDRKGMAIGTSNRGRSGTGRALGRHAPGGAGLAGERLRQERGAGRPHEHGDASAGSRWDCRPDADHDAGGAPRALRRGGPAARGLPGSRAAWIPYYRVVFEEGGHLDLTGDLPRMVANVEAVEARRRRARTSTSWPRPSGSCAGRAAPSSSARSAGLRDLARSRTCCARSCARGRSRAWPSMVAEHFSLARAAPGLLLPDALPRHAARPARRPPT